MATAYKTVLQDTVSNNGGGSFWFNWKYISIGYNYRTLNCSQNHILYMQLKCKKYVEHFVNVNGYNWKYINDYGNKFTVSSLLSVSHAAL